MRRVHRRAIPKCGKTATSGFGRFVHGNSIIYTFIREIEVKRAKNSADISRNGTVGTAWRHEIRRFARLYFLTAAYSSRFGKKHLALATPARFTAHEIAQYGDGLTSSLTPRTGRHGKACCQMRWSGQLSLTKGDFQRFDPGGSSAPRIWPSLTLRLCRFSVKRSNECRVKDRREGDGGPARQSGPTQPPA